MKLKTLLFSLMLVASVGQVLTDKIVVHISTGFDRVSFRIDDGRTVGDLLDAYLNSTGKNKNKYSRFEGRFRYVYDPEKTLREVSIGHQAILKYTNQP